MYNYTEIEALSQSEIESCTQSELRSQELEALVQKSQEKEKTDTCSLPRGFGVDKQGVFYKQLAEDSETEAVRICSPLKVTAITRDSNGKNHGRLLEFHDSDQRLHTWAMPMELLAGDGTEYRKELLSRGLVIEPNRKAKGLLSIYIQSTIPTNKALCVDKVGWHNNCFVLPNETFVISQIAVEKGENEHILLQTERPFNHFSKKGTLEDWKDNVSSLCEGNCRLTFAVSLSLTAPLLQLLDQEGGGFHIFGESSTGKTTALLVACSTWGSEKYMQKWRATTNGLESIAVAYNDCLLCLDELAQIDPQQAGDAAYTLSSGRGKVRANREGGARLSQEWRILILSTGEITLGEHMREGKKRVRAGHEVRIIDIPANTGKYGLFENTHGCANGKNFSELLKQKCLKSYGTAGPEFLKKLTQNPIETLKKVKECIVRFEDDLRTLPEMETADGQALRVLHKFALVAAIGEVATELGITGWKENEAYSGAKSCFETWLDHRGGSGPKEEEEVLRCVEHFFNTHGNSRFTPWDEPEKQTYDRAGFKKIQGNSLEFYLYVEVFRNEICAGLDKRMVEKICLKHKLILPESPSRLDRTRVDRNEYLPGKEGKKRVYRFVRTTPEESKPQSSLEIMNDQEEASLNTMYSPTFGE